MKLFSPRFALAVLAISSFSALAGQSIAATDKGAEKGWTSNFSQARAKAKRQRKLMMVDFNATWCVSCQTYREKVFSTPAFKRATKNVVLVTIDTDHQPALATKFDVSGLPDIRFITPEGKVVGGVVGYVGQQKLLADLAKAKKAVKRS